MFLWKGEIHCPQYRSYSWAPQAWARGGTCPYLPLWKCCKVFSCISSYSKTPSRRIIYALFSQPLVSFWGLCPRPHQEWNSPRTSLGNFCPQTLNLPSPPPRKSCERPWLYCITMCAGARRWASRHLLVVLAAYLLHLLHCWWAVTSISVQTGRSVVASSGKWGG